MPDLMHVVKSSRHALTHLTLTGPSEVLTIVPTPHSGELEPEKTKVKQSVYGATEPEGRLQVAWLQSRFLFINEEAEAE